MDRVDLPAPRVSVRGDGVANRRLRVPSVRVRAGLARLTVEKRAAATFTRRRATVRYRIVVVAARNAATASSVPVCDTPGAGRGCAPLQAAAGCATDAPAGGSGSSRRDGSACSGPPRASRPAPASSATPHAPAPGTCAAGRRSPASPACALRRRSRASVPPARARSPPAEPILFCRTRAPRPAVGGRWVRSTRQRDGLGSPTATARCAAPRRLALAPRGPRWPAPMSGHLDRTVDELRRIAQ